MGKIRIHRRTADHKEGRDAYCWAYLVWFPILADRLGYMFISQVHMSVPMINLILIMCTHGYA